MSGQCLSPSETGHALTPANHLCLGRPLPHQQANSKQTAPRAINLWSGDIIRYYSRFRMAIPNPWVRIYSLLSLSPLSVLKINRSIFLKLLARLACLIHAANVHSEPGSNPSILYRFTSAAEASPGKIKFKPKADSAPGSSVKDPSDSPFSFVLHDEPQVTHSIQPNSNLALLNSTEVSSPNCQRSVNHGAR